MQNNKPFNSTGSTRSKPAIFLDRDGTLIEDVGVLDHPNMIKVYSDTFESLRLLQKEYALFVITNQSGVSKGKITLEDVYAVNDCLNAMLQEQGIVIHQWYVCPHHRKEGCSCIKPKPEFARRAAKDYGLDLTKSFVIGDHPHDTFTANEEGVFGLYLLTGHGSRHLDALSNEKLIFHRLMDAATWILEHPVPTIDLSNKINEGAAIIQNGGVVAFPTETVYGLGADVFQPDAVKKIFKIKGRPHNNPLIAHISDVKQLEQLVTNVPDSAQRLIDLFWPGPLTLVLPKRKEVPDLVTAGLNSVAVRMSAHPIADRLIRNCNTPVAAPSANRYTCTSPTTAQHVKEQLGDKCDLIIDGGACRVGVESTVISFAEKIPVILRPGGVPTEAIEHAIGSVKILSEDAEKEQPKESPGMIPNHYAPATDLFVFDEIPPSYEQQKDIGVLLFKPSEQRFSGTTEVLSPTGDTKEAATNLFAALRRLDDQNLRLIVAQLAPNEEVGVAINNRLKKAAKGRKETS